MSGARAVAALAGIAISINPCGLSAVRRTSKLAFASGPGTVCIEARRTPTATAELLLVPVEVSARGRQRQYWFLLDTGSGVSLVDDEVATALELPRATRTTLMTATGAVAATTARLSLTFGAVHADDLEVVRHPLTELRAVDPDVHGLIGQDVLRRTHWLLDNARGVIVQDPSRALDRRDGVERLAVRWIGDRPVVDAAFGRSSFPLVLDSAATSIVLYAVPAGSAPAAYTRMKTPGAEHAAPLFTADALRIGSMTMAQPMAAVVPQDSDADEARGVLPTSLFESVYFDHHDSAALVRPARRSGGPRRIIRPRCDAADALVS